MGDFKQKNIEDIVLGDSVLTYSYKFNLLKAEVVTKIDSPLQKEFIRIQFQGNIENKNPFSRKVIFLESKY